MRTSNFHSLAKARMRRVHQRLFFRMWIIYFYTMLNIFIRVVRNSRAFSSRINPPENTCRPVLAATEGSHT